MRLKSWLAATAGVLSSGAAVAQSADPTHFDVAPAGGGLPAPAAPAARPAFALPGEAVPLTSYHDVAPTGGLPDPHGFMATADQRAPHAFWVSADYLLWWSRTMGTPALASRIPAAAVGGAGVLGNRLFPEDRKIDFGAQSGYRVSGGVQLTECYSLEGSFFQLERATEGGRFALNGLPGTDGLGRPYLPAGAAGGRVLYSALPGQYAGVIDIAPSTVLYGLEASVGVDTFRLFSDRNTALYGFRFVDLAERITVTDASTFPNGRANTVQDVFATRNQFYGGQIGLRSQFFGGQNWYFETLGKFGMGGVNQRVEVFGANANLFPNGTVDRENGGLLARPTNSGVFERDRFAVTLDLTLSLGYQITPRLRGTFGYSVFYLSNAVRPGGVIDPLVNDSNIRFVNPPDRTASTAARPGFNWGRAATDFYAQGLNFGLHFGY